MSNTVQGIGGTNYEVTVQREDTIVLTTLSSYRGTGQQVVWEGSLSIENSQHLRILLEEAEIEARPKPSKADRIRAELRRGCKTVPTDRSISANIYRILDEDGDL